MEFCDASFVSESSIVFQWLWNLKGKKVNIRKYVVCKGRNLGAGVDVV